MRGSRQLTLGALCGQFQIFNLIDFVWTVLNVWILVALCGQFQVFKLNGFVLTAPNI